MKKLGEAPGDFGEVPEDLGEDSEVPVKSKHSIRSEYPQDIPGKNIKDLN